MRKLEPCEFIRERLIHGTGGRQAREQWSYTRLGVVVILLNRLENTIRPDICGEWHPWDYATHRWLDSWLIYPNEQQARRAIMRRCTTKKKGN